MQEILSNLKSIAERHGIPSYYLWSFGYFLDSADFKGKRVLEVGGSSLPREFIEALGVLEWASVDIIGHSAGEYQQDLYASHYCTVPSAPLDQIHRFLCKEFYYICDGDAVFIPEAVTDHFDIVVSVNAFEHVLDFPGLLTTLDRVLRPQGMVLSSFGPIWSCAHGSHFWINSDWYFDKPGPLPAHAHMLMSPSDTYDHLTTAGIPRKLAGQAVNQIYTASRINRLGFDDYRRFLELSTLDVQYFKPHYSVSVSEEMQNLLKSRHPSYDDFSTYSAVLCAKKRG